ncbi:MAG: 23S rRNA (pseudouridine(1915)-N(3))-methyltransferase RlmH [Deltaproteobacteria bacterium]|nr:23S rRNA (pseudouridine(1915)-N(3))-methyltransferase RlmH [Deltaproteobacteria bacterium]
MRKIKLIFTGRSQEGFMAEGLRLYQEKLKHYCEFEVVFVKESKYLDGQLEKSLFKEAERIGKTFSKNSFKILLDERGRQMDSIELADWFRGMAGKGISELEFVVGGAYGVHQEIKDKVDGLVALSRMTLNHQVARLVLLEQLYRCFTIIKGQKYHH